MLDINFVRENPDLIKKSEEKRDHDSKKVDEVLKLDLDWKRELKVMEELNHKRNVVSKEINESKKSGNSSLADKKIKEMRKVIDTIKSQENLAVELLKKRNSVLTLIGNVLDDSVPKGKDDSENEEIKKVGTVPKFDFKIKDHIELGLELDLIDLDTAAKTTGARFYYLKNEAVLLSQALQRFAIDRLLKKKYTLIQTPYMLNRNAMGGAVNLKDFEEVIYKIEDEDLYLIGTAEHALAALYQDELLNIDKPIKYAGLSSCFRKEAGSHGKDTKGIFRVHRFEKIEQFVFCKPEDEDKIFNEIINNQEEIFKLLEIPYHIIFLCTGETGGSMSKTYDLEGWFPAQKKYRELGSTSSATTFQSRKLNEKYLNKNKREHVYTINGTAMTVQRTMCCILENNQQKDGSIKIPKALHKYTGFKEIKAGK